VAEPELAEAALELRPELAVWERAEAGALEHLIGRIVKPS
jgi:hypothetical protein